MASLTGWLRRVPIGARTLLTPPSPTPIFLIGMHRAPDGLSDLSAAARGDWKRTRAAWGDVLVDAALALRADRTLALLLAPLQEVSRAVAGGGAFDWQAAELALHCIRWVLLWMLGCCITTPLVSLQLDSQRYIEVYAAYSFASVCARWWRPLPPATTSEALLSAAPPSPYTLTPCTQRAPTAGVCARWWRPLVTRSSRRYCQRCQTCPPQDQAPRRYTFATCCSDHTFVLLIARTNKSSRYFTHCFTNKQRAHCVRPLAGRVPLLKTSGCFFGSKRCKWPRAPPPPPHTQLRYTAALVVAGYSEWLGRSLSMGRCQGLLQR